MTTRSLPQLVHALYPAVMAAGAAILNHRNAHTPIEIKADGSPVSSADRDAEAILLASLSLEAPGVPVIAEEAASATGTAPHAGTEFFLVDPLDGTREYAAGRNEFTVNVALVRNRVPVLGMILAPATGELYWTEESDEAFFARVSVADAPGSLAALARSRLHTREFRSSFLTAVASRSHNSNETENWLSKMKVAERVHLGSSLKFCLIASGKADVYPRFGRTMEWDTAAGDALVRAAGGSVTLVDGLPLLYGKSAEGYANPGFIAWSKAPPSAIVQETAAEQS